MKDLIEESLSNSAESFGIDLKGKESEIAECICSDIRLLTPATSSGEQRKSVDNNYKERFIHDLRRIPPCGSCNGSGLHVDGFNQCHFCRGTGKLLSWL